MKITLYTKHVDLDKKTEDEVYAKLRKIETYTKDIMEAQIELDEDKSMQTGPKFRAEAMMILPRHSFRAESTDVSILTAIDLLLPKIKKQVELYKNKYKSPRQNRGIKAIRDKQ